MSSVYFHPLAADARFFGVQGSRIALFCRCLPGAFAINILSDSLSKGVSKQVDGDRVVLLACTSLSLALTVITVLALNILGVVWLGLEGLATLGVLGVSSGAIARTVYKQTSQAVPPTLKERQERVMQEHIAKARDLTTDAIKKIREKHGQTVG